MSEPNDLPVGWETMTSIQIGSEFRDTSEPGGSRLMLNMDYKLAGVVNPMVMDFMDISLPSLSAQAYSTQLLAQRKWATQGVSRIIQGDQITGTIECPAVLYEELIAFLGGAATARIEIPTQSWFSQWRVSVLSVDGPSLTDGDRMTASLVLTVTHTGPDEKSEMGPVFGTYVEADDWDTEPAGTPLVPS